MEKGDLQKILSRYEIGDYVDSKLIYKTKDSLVYDLRTSQSRFALKVMNSLPSDYARQLEVVNLLSEHDIPVVRNIMNTNKKIIEICVNLIVNSHND